MTKENITWKKVWWDALVVVADHEDMIKRLRSQNSTHHIQLGKMDLRQKCQVGHILKYRIWDMMWSWMLISACIYYVLVSKKKYLWTKRNSWFKSGYIANQLLANFFNWLRIFGIPEKEYLLKLHVFWWRQRMFFSFLD